MEATTVRVEETVKRELDRMQGLLQAETGERVSHSELLARLLAVARKHEAELFERPETEWRPPTREQLDRVLAKVKDWGVETDASKVDEALYGGSPHE
jgi:hypothetical protein